MSSRFNENFLLQEHTPYDSSMNIAQEQIFQSPRYISLEIFQGLLQQTLHNEGNEYTLVKILGCGTTSCVYLALDQKNKLRAIKILPSEQAIEELECLQSISKICGNSILCLIDNFPIRLIHNDYIAIVTDFVEGYISLEKFLTDPFYVIDLSESENLIKTLQSTLGKIINLGIAHGDISASNILINPDTLEIRFIDFGYCTRNPTSEDIEADLFKLNFIFDQIENKVVKPI